MFKLAGAPAQERQNIFSDIATKLGINPAIIEKDFWVCLVLKILFADSPLKEHLVFKGGTSLSKVFKLVERFSEDIDLVLDWKLLGADQDLAQEIGSKNKQDRFNKEINRRAGLYIRDTICPQLNEIFARHGVALRAQSPGEDLQVINITYPAAFSEEYIRPEVRLEIGPLASWVPSTKEIVKPYAYDVYPELFTEPYAPVLVIAAERTFWEKATILHQEAHRPDPIPPRHSRHYYDLYKLTLSAVRDKAMADLRLLQAVVEFKTRFYPSGWARYDLAKPGSFKLLPSDETQIAHLAEDYRQMRVMIFGEQPEFPAILEELKKLDVAINALAPN
jgi:predicted nucleotidyltransferase component of viral defense system